MNTTSILLTTLLLALLAAAAHSSPFSIPEVTAYRGDTVAVTLWDDAAQGLEAVTLQIAYDPDQLAFQEAVVGTLTHDFLLEANPTASVRVSLAFGQPPINGQSGSILTAQFLIRSTASVGETTVTMVCPAPCFDYDISPTTGHISILDNSSPLPEASTPLLLLLGLILFDAQRRRLS